jgi:hypothetical protein
MLKKITPLTITILILASAFLMLNQNISSASTGDPAKLNIYIGPPNLLADNNIYNCIFVQLQDSSGQPARALQDTTISLSSSLPNIGTVDSSITIPKGDTYASANFYSTLTSGTTTITASVTGFSTVTATLTTITPIPSTIAVFGFPSTLPADGGTYPAIMVQLQDSNGLPQRAPPNGVNVTLSCSETSVGAVTPSVVTIPYGQTYAIANFTTTTTPSTTPATITTLANGYTPKTVEIRTKNVTSDPKNLVIFVGPNQILADNNQYPQIAIELQDASGNIAAATSNITLTLISTDVSIGQINSTITIGPESQFQTYGIATLNTTYKAGPTYIFAAATNMNSDNQLVTTVEFIPPKLAVYAIPSILPSDNSTYQTIQVQLQDSRGRPAKNLEENVSINLFSQHPNVAAISSPLIISSGKTQANGNLTVTNAAGTTQITAQASGYTTGQTSITTYVIDYSSLQISVSANPTSVNNGYTSTITTYVTANGTPLTGATVTFASNNGGSFTSPVEQGNGYYNVSFTAPNFSITTNCTITASGTKSGYLSDQTTTQLTVTPVPASAATPTPTPSVIPTAAPTPIPSSNTNTGTLALCIKDNEGNTLMDTLVSSIVQPTGMRSLSDVSNSTGYVNFQNVTAGLYTFKIIKEGYPEMNQTIDYNGQPLALSIALFNGNANSNVSINLILIIAIAAIVIAIAVASSLYIVRHKKSANIKKLQEMQKQLKNKYK